MIKLHKSSFDRPIELATRNHDKLRFRPPKISFTLQLRDEARERRCKRVSLSLERDTLENNFAIINNNKFSLQISTRKKYSREFYPLRRAPSPREEVTGR